jgi:hypothetical protein
MTCPRLPGSFAQVYRKDTFDAPGGDSFGERFGEIQFAGGVEVPEQPDILGGVTGRWATMRAGRRSPPSSIGIATKIASGSPCRIYGDHRLKG